MLCYQKYLLEDYKLTSTFEGADETFKCDVI